MTAKEYVQLIYSEARFIRWNSMQAAISIGTEKDPYLTLGWKYIDIDDNEDSLWEKAKISIQEMMLEKLSE